MRGLVNQAFTPRMIEMMRSRIQTLVDRMDITRTDNRRVAFAQGIHYWWGLSLARMEAQIAIGTLLNRMPDIELASDSLKWNPSTVLRGLKSLQVAF